MTGRAKLLGTWRSDKGNLWYVEKSYGKFLTIQFRIVTFYKDFGFNSDFIYGDEHWNRFDPESFQDLIERFKLVKIEEVKN
jgi:hypothetical protein